METNREQEIKEFAEKHDVVVVDRKTYELTKKIDIAILVILVISTILDIVMMFK